MLKKILPGVLLCLLIALVAKFASQYLPSLGSVSLAIILGLIIGNILPRSEYTAPGVKFSEKKILESAIILMGFNLQLSTLGNLGIKAFVIVLPVMLVTILLGISISKLLGFSTRFGCLIGIGSAVCGSSAIAAAAPVLEAHEDEIGISISVVNLMGAVGIFLLPPLAATLSMTDIESSYLVGGTLQAIGHVVAAGFSINDSVGDTATIIKMLRVLMIGPIVIILSLMLRNKGESQTAKKGFLPYYIIGFAICSIIATVFHEKTDFLHFFKIAAKYLLMIAMAGVGMKIRFSDLLKEGPKAIIAIVVLFAFQLTIMTLMIKLINP
ncbi:MAG: YeiH family protein [Sedimentisphaeraceae bacterium JB056]